MNHTIYKVENINKPTKFIILNNLIIVIIKIKLKTAIFGLFNNLSIKSSQTKYENKIHLFFEVISP